MSDYDFASTTALRFGLGHEHNPVSPGHLIVEVARQGGVRLHHEKGSVKRSWTAEQSEALWPALVSALRKARFPASPPPQDVPAGTPTFEVTALRRDQGADTLWYVAGPMHAEVTRLFLTVTAQITGRAILDFDMPSDIQYVAGVVEVKP